PCAATRPRATERARQRRPHGQGARGGAWREPRRACGAHRRQRERRLSPAVTVVPKKSLGQHFLADSNMLGVIERLAALDDRDVVLEIGPGLGVLTRYLAERVAHVHAVELDRSLEPVLREAVSGHENVALRFADALDVEPATLQPTPTKLVANLPY